MNKTLVVLSFIILFALDSMAQDQTIDSTKIVNLEEVIVIGLDVLNNHKQGKTQKIKETGSAKRDIHRKAGDSLQGRYSYI